MHVESDRMNMVELKRRQGCSSSMQGQQVREPWIEFKIYRLQKIINYESVKKRGRLLKTNVKVGVTSHEGSNMKSFQNNVLLVRTALPTPDQPVIVPVVIIISVTVKKDST